MLPLGIVLGGPEEVVPEMTAWPMVGNGALGSMVQALVPAVEEGHAGGVVFSVAAYADNPTPVGFNVAHWLCRLVKSGAIGVGVPCRVNLSKDQLSAIEGGRIKDP